MIHKHPHGPKIKVDFYTGDGLLQKTTLNLHHRTATEWEIFSYEKNHALEEKISSWMHEYCEGKQPDIQLPYSLTHFPSFTKSVLNTLPTIPFGNHLSYHELAILLKNQGASRAVGTSCGRNLLPLVIPCHRVLAKGNHLGGFSAGIPIKQELLRFEKIHYIS